MASNQVNIFFGFYHKNAIKNPDLTTNGPSRSYYDVSGSQNLTLSPMYTHAINDGNFIWGSGVTTGYTGTFSISTSFFGGTTILLGGNNSNNYSIDITLTPSVYTIANIGSLNEEGWSVIPIQLASVTYGFTLSYSGLTTPPYIPYILIMPVTYLASSQNFKYQIDSDNLFVQTISLITGLLPAPPIKFDIVPLSVAAGTTVNISENEESSYYTHNFTSNVNIIETNVLALGSGTGFGSNLNPFILRDGSVETTVYNPKGMLFFIGTSSFSTESSRQIDLVFSIGGKVLNFPIYINISVCPGWSGTTGNYQGGISNLASLFFYNNFTPTSYPAFQINIDPIASVKVEVKISSNDPSLTEGIGVQGMQFATSSPIPICLVTDCMVWTSLGLEKIQDLKSGCQLVAVDIEGNEFLAKFDVYQQTPRNADVDICRHEPDVIVSDYHTILYPDDEIKDFKCKNCEESKPYTNQLGKASCHHCHIFNIKNHTPVVSWKSWLPIEKADATLYHVIPEDLINVKGFKVGERRVLISEITTSDIQLYMSGFVKV